MKKLSLAGLLLGSLMVLQVQAAAPNASIILKTNQQMVNISLGANPSTGYQWYAVDYDRNLLSLENYRYVPNAKNGKVGTGGAAVFTFSVDPRFFDAPQKTLVTFAYERPSSPGVNATTVQVSVSATASSNDYSNWQKYPQLAGPAAEVQASEAQIKMEDQGTQLSAPPVLVQTPGSNAAPAATSSTASTSAKTTSTVASPAAVTTNTPAEASSDANAPAPNASNSQDNTGTVMPAGQPTPETDSQSQWLSLPANSAAPASGNKASGSTSTSTPVTTTASPSSTN